MSKIMHFTKIKEGSRGDEEYIIITEDDLEPAEKNTIPDFIFNKEYTIEGNLGTLPLEIPLFPKR